jgi:uncharacterized protein (TIGR03000 family)
MYSVIVMAALSTGGDVANCHWRHGDCNGCYGGCYGSGYGCSGWYNGTCYGSCYGGYGCHGFSYGCSGCWGGCYGCYGGCWGGCYGGAGCYGSVGTSPMYGPMYYAPSSVPPNSQMMPPAKPDTLPEPKATTPGASVPYRARLIVELPADARLYIDDQLMKTTSEHRAFNTPALAKGQTYYYDLRAEAVRDGKSVTLTKRVTLKAGEVIEARFGEMETAEAVSTVKAR